VRASVLLKGEKEARECKREWMRVAAKIAHTKSQHDNVVHVWVEGWLGWVKEWARDEVSTTTQVQCHASKHANVMQVRKST
jgi:hypothetical protein